MGPYQCVFQSNENDIILNRWSKLIPIGSNTNNTEIEFYHSTEQENDIEYHSTTDYTSRKELVIDEYTVVEVAVSIA